MIVLAGKVRDELMPMKVIVDPQPRSSPTLLASKNVSIELARTINIIGRNGEMEGVER